jgi:ribosomal protein S18 acetylase RimI-like enzyme
MRHVLPPTIRPATVADVAAMAETVTEGFETYREWAPRGWDPPAPALQLAGIRDRLPTAGCICFVAEHATPAGGSTSGGEDSSRAPSAPPTPVRPAPPPAVRSAPPPAVRSAPRVVVAGQVAYVPAREELGVAHIWMLFVRREAWGSGIAALLLARAVEEATHEGYASMRLHTPAEHRRARAFYEREGWSAASPPFYEPMLGLTLVTYRRPL